MKILEAMKLGLNKDTIKYLEKQAQKKASELAHEAQQRLTDFIKIATVLFFMVVLK